MKRTGRGRPRSPSAHVETCAGAQWDLPAQVLVSVCAAGLMFEVLQKTSEVKLKEEQMSASRGRVAQGGPKQTGPLRCHHKTKAQ